MTLLGDGKFWLSVLVCTAVTVLACLRIVSGDLAVGTMTGLVGGFAVGKAWKNGAPK